MSAEKTNRESWMLAERRVRTVSALVGVLLTVLAGWFALSGLGARLRTLSYDMPYLIHEGGGMDDVRVVYLDQLKGESLDRSVQPQLLDKLNEAGARAVLYDLVFDQPWEDAGVDREFAAAMLRFRGVDENGEPVPGARRRHVYLAFGREQLEQTGFAGERLIPPTDELLAAADDFGLVALVCDDAFVVRELSAGTPDEPSMTWKAAAELGGKLKEDDRPSPKWINYAGTPRGTGSNNQAAAIPSLGASNVFADDSSGMLRDKLVIVGGKPGIVGEALGQDLFSSPFHLMRGDLSLMSGVEIQANILANLMRGNWLTRSGRTFDLWMVIAAGLLAGAGFTMLRPLRGVIAALLCILILFGAAVIAMNQARMWFPWSVVAFLQVPVALGWGAGSRFYIEKFFRRKLTEEQKFLKEAFEKYLSPQMLERMTEDGFKMKIGGEKVMAAMMFTDLESFTNMCERVGDPEKIVEALSDYFERTTGHIFEHDGVIIKFIGDAIFAAWGAPIPDAESPVKAARAAWYLSRSDNLVVEGVNLRTRIGVHYGEVVAGNIGSRKRVDYTMIGDAVNLSARLEALNKRFGTHILISGEVHSHLGDEFITRKVGNFKVKGRKEPTVVYELLGPVADVEVPAWLAVYAEGFAALEEDDFVKARALFSQTDIMRGDGGDGPSRFYLELLDAGALIEAGMYEMTEK